MSTAGTDLAVYDGGQIDPYRPQIMTPQAARELDEQLRQCVRAVLREGTDYGIIPGTSGEKVLFRPGAQRLLQWFGLTFTCDRTDIEHDDEGRKHGITYRAVVSKRGTGEVLATCEGTADYDESKFYKGADQVQREAEARERSWAKKDRRVANPEKWKHLPEYRAPWNTLVKRAQKRAIVGATIDATAAGGVFADDEDSDTAPADGGPSLYQQLLGEAAYFPAKEDGKRLWGEASQAKLNGDITRDQADHIHNRIRQRVDQLDSHIQINVENLDTEDPIDAASGDALPVPAPEAASTPAGGERPTALAASGQVSLIQKQFRRLGTDPDTEDGWAHMLAACARLARLAAIASLQELTQDEARDILNRLKTLPDGIDGVKALDALLSDGDVHGGQ
jgi:hypothetical protein